MNLYKIYVATKKKDGTVTKSESIATRAEDQEKAIASVISQAKVWYGYKGKVHICSVWIKDDKKQWNKLEPIN
jgi:hypothetical protein